MSTKHDLRHERTCLNCGHQVKERFCCHCGQENIEIRQTFGHLVSHFFEDLTHYEGRFWITMRYLLFRPAFLSRQFLKGRRHTYVLPVRLYIFISFITFLLPHLLPQPSRTTDTHSGQGQPQSDNSIRIIGNEFRISMPRHYRNLHELDSTENSLPPEKRMGSINYWIEKRIIYLHTKSPDELWEKFSESFDHSFPKALFVYMPLFALLLWLFHSKKRWLYFDHAIFTLHYFSFMLLLNSLLSILLTVFNFAVDYNTSIVISFFGMLAQNLAFLVYFYIAHKKMYRESIPVSALKSTLIMIIANILFIALMLLISVYTMLMIH